MMPAQDRSVVRIRNVIALTALVMGACSAEGPGDELGSTTLAVGPKPDLDTPTLSSPGATQTTITVRVCAGATGAPAGFSLHWVTADEYAANSWGDDPCAASFSGVPGGSRFNLDPGECTDVVVGALDDSEIGLSFSCNEPLQCGTDYVFRTFAHANSQWSRSDFSEPSFFSTLACDDGCTYTQGFWKNHVDAWPVSELDLGSVEYTVDELLAILGQPVAGNGLISLSHQLIAAKLNIASGANATAISSTVAASDALIGSVVVPPIGSGYLAPASTGALTSALDDWNNGVTGPGHCE